MESLEQRIQRGIREKIDIEPYDARWVHSFEEERRHLLSCLPQNLVVRVEHFGSTAVPGLAAKPIVDMLIEISCLGETQRTIAPILQEQGYDYFWRPTHGDDGPPWYGWFIKRNAAGLRTHHLHMVEASFEGHWDRLLFRDYLIANPETAQQYETLKLELAHQHPSDRVQYTHAKSEFVNRVTQLAKLEQADKC
jgi:GrpB-like predicted nucleotidyltransferase (UPF0157 family)